MQKHGTVVYWMSSSQKTVLSRPFFEKEARRFIIQKSVLLLARDPLGNPISTFQVWLVANGAR